MTDIARAVCLLERGKVEVNIAQTTEVIGRLGEMLYLDDTFEILKALTRNGERRVKSRKKRRK
jgi:hypothetical protein